MKNYVRLLLQKILGFQNYLFYFSVFTIKRLRYNKSEESFLHFLSIIPNNGIILDIGANIGNTVVPIAEYKKAARILAFEPVAQNLLALKRVVKYFNLKNVTIVPKALGDKPGFLQMIMPEKNGAKQQGLSHVYSSDDQKGETGEIYDVEVLVLDEMRELQDADTIAAIKIDVENYEYPVFKGAHNLLKKHKPIIYCELWDNDNRVKVIGYLKNLGYRVQLFKENGLIDYKEDMNKEVMNFFFLPLDNM